MGGRESKHVRRPAEHLDPIDLCISLDSANLAADSHDAVPLAEASSELGQCDANGQEFVRAVLLSYCLPRSARGSGTVIPCLRLRVQARAVPVEKLMLILDYRVLCHSRRDSESGAQPQVRRPCLPA